MTTRRINLSLLLGITILFYSCVSDMFGVEGKGAVVSQSQKTTDFQSIVLLTNADVTIAQDTVYRVEVEDYENLLDYTKATVNSKKLVIALLPASTILKNSVAKVRIWLPDSLTTLVVSGSGSMDVNAGFKDLSSLIVTGSGNIRVKSALNVRNLLTQSSGSGSITAKGSVAKLGAQIGAAGNLNFDSLNVKYAQCYNLGSGSITVRTDTLNAVIAGSGDVHYYGTPVVYMKVTGSGKLIKK